MGQKSQPQLDNARTGSRKGERYFSRTFIRLQKAGEKTNSPLKTYNAKQNTSSHSRWNPNPREVDGNFAIGFTMPTISPTFQPFPDLRWWQLTHFWAYVFICWFKSAQHYIKKSTERKSWGFQTLGDDKLPEARVLISTTPSATQTVLRTADNAVFCSQLHQV